MHSAICTGWLSHCRHQPRRHAFRYRLFMLYLDLAELDRVFAGRWLWSCTRPALARFDRRDHFGDPAEPLDESVRRLVEQHTGRRPEGPVRLLTHLRYFGHVFNPASFYYCFAADGRTLEAVVAEVTNTPWRERHCYVIPGGAGTHQKAMHVSPFHPMDQAYRWRFESPGQRLKLRIRLLPLHAPEAPPVFDASLALRCQPVTGPGLALALLRFPLMTLQVIAAIHWQALRLWLKRVPVHDHPAKRPVPHPQEPA